MSDPSHAFWLPKAGNAESDYEDAFAVAGQRVAIADGATESSFARAWAEALVQGLVSADLSADGIDPRDAAAAALQRKVTSLQRVWHSRIAWDRLPWFAEDKARSGAFATLLTFHYGVDMEEGGAVDEGAEKGASRNSAARWSAVAVGDSCLFQVRDRAMIAAFPLERAEQFNSRPMLLSSNAANNERVWDTLVQREGECLPGDLFLFATDALAHWFLEEVESGATPWETLLDVRSHADFAALVDRLRGAHVMRNDDVTLVRLVVPDNIAPREEGELSVAQEGDGTSLPTAEACVQLSTAPGAPPYALAGSMDETSPAQDAAPPATGEATHPFTDTAEAEQPLVSDESWGDRPAGPPAPDVVQTEEIE